MGRKAKTAQEFPPEVMADLTNAGFFQCDRKERHWHHERLAFAWPTWAVVKLMSDTWFEGFSCCEGPIKKKGACLGRAH